MNIGYIVWMFFNESLQDCSRTASIVRAKAVAQPTEDSDAQRHIVGGMSHCGEN